MSRSKYKGLFINKDLVKKTNRYKIKVFNKKLTIIPEYVDKNEFVYNCINFIFWFKCNLLFFIIKIIKDLIKKRI